MTHPTGAAHMGRATLSNSAWYCGQLITFLAIGEDTEGRCALLRVHASQGTDGLPWHAHAGEDETIYVLHGELTVVCAGGEELQQLQAVSGDSVTIPRGLAHTLRYDSSDVTFLLHFSPAGFERYFHAMSEPAEYLGLPGHSGIYQAPPDGERMAATAARYGCVFTLLTGRDQTA